MLDHIIIILHRPRDPVNIGGVVRAMKNMGVRRLRLVDPVAFDAYHITGIAHRSDDILAAAEQYATLDEALADVGYVIGTTARQRSERPVRDDIRMLAGDWIARSAHTTVACVFGPEDTGLDNAALDRCHLVVSLPVDPTYASLNLAQAALLLMYELRMAALAQTDASTAAKSAFPPPTGAQYEQLFDSTERALHAMEFFKPGRAEGVMRTLRALTFRAAPDQREIGLLTAIAREVVNVLRRRAQGHTTGDASE